MAEGLDRLQATAQGAAADRRAGDRHDPGAAGGVCAGGAASGDRRSELYRQFAVTLSTAVALSRPGGANPDAGPSARCCCACVLPAGGDVAGV